MAPEDFPVAKYTVQLYYVPAGKPVDKNIPFQIASGVLIRKYKRHFLLTCRHVFDHINPSYVIIFTSWGFAVRLLDEVKLINNETDSIDLALVAIKGVRLEALKAHYGLLPHRYLGFHHIFDEDLSLKSCCIVMGAR